MVRLMVTHKEMWWDKGGLTQHIMTQQLVPSMVYLAATLRPNQDPKGKHHHMSEI